MNKKGEFKLFLLIILITAIIACESKVEKVYYPNGKLKFVGKVNNDLPEGLCSTFYDNGLLMQISNWDHGKMNGTRRYFYENGNLKEKSFWKNDSLDGWASFYSPNGKISIVGKYNNGLGDGWFKYYDPAGKLSSMVEYFIYDGEALPNQNIKFTKNGGIIKDKSNYYVIEPKLDTLIRNKEYSFNFMLKGSLYNQNMRVILNESLSFANTKSDTIEGKGLSAIIRINPKWKGKFKLYGKVQEYTNPVITPKGFSYKSRDLFFKKEYIVK